MLKHELYLKATKSQKVSEGVQKSNAKKNPPMALCFEWGFTRTFPGNQDVAVK